MGFFDSKKEKQASVNPTQRPQAPVQQEATLTQIGDSNDEENTDGIETYEESAEEVPQTVVRATPVNPQNTVYKSVPPRQNSTQRAVEPVYREPVHQEPEETEEQQEEVHANTEVPQQVDMRLVESVMEEFEGRLTKIESFLFRFGGL